MVLEVERARGEQLAVALDDEELRQPAGGADGALRFMQRMEVLVAHEGRGVALRLEQAVPSRRLDVRGAIEHPNDIIVRGCFLSHRAMLGPRHKSPGFPRLNSAD
jgi:hypothetical protein